MPKDDWSMGWIDFQEFVDSLRTEYNLTKEDILDYFAMYTKDMRHE